MGETSNKPVTVGELYEFMKICLADDPEAANKTVWIVTEDNGFPSTPGSAVRTFNMGFDWNQGKFMLFPQRALIRKK